MTASLDRTASMGSWKHRLIFMGMFVSFVVYLYISALFVGVSYGIVCDIESISTGTISKSLKNDPINRYPNHVYLVNPVRKKRRMETHNRYHCTY